MKIPVVGVLSRGIAAAARFVRQSPGLCTLIFLASFASAAVADRLVETTAVSASMIAAAMAAAVLWLVLASAPLVAVARMVVLGDPAIERRPVLRLFALALGFLAALLGIPAAVLAVGGPAAWIGSLVVVATFVVALRGALCLPLVAVDAPRPLRTALDLSVGNAWRLAAVTVIPLVAIELIDELRLFVGRLVPAASLVADAVGAVGDGFVSLALAASLSLAYVALAREGAAPV